MIGTACIATAGAIIAERNGLRFSSQPFGTMDNSLLFVAWASSASSVIAAIIGCFSMLTNIHELHSSFEVTNMYIIYIYK